MAGAHGFRDCLYSTSSIIDMCRQRQAIGFSRVTAVITQMPSKERSIIRSMLSEFVYVEFGPCCAHYDRMSDLSM